VHRKLASDDKLVPEHLNVALVARVRGSECLRLERDRDDRDVPEMEIGREVALLSEACIVALDGVVLDRGLCGAGGRGKEALEMPFRLARAAAQGLVGCVAACTHPRDAAVYIESTQHGLHPAVEVEEHRIVAAQHQQGIELERRDAQWGLGDVDQVLLYQGSQAAAKSRGHGFMPVCQQLRGHHNFPLNLKHRHLRLLGQPPPPLPEQACVAAVGHDASCQSRRRHDGARRLSVHDSEPDAPRPQVGGHFDQPLEHEGIVPFVSLGVVVHQAEEHDERLGCAACHESVLCRHNRS